LAVVAGYTVVRGNNPWTLLLTVLTLAVAHSLLTIWNDIEDQEVDAYNGITSIARMHGDGLYGGLLWTLLLASILIFLASMFLPAPTALLFAGLMILGWMYNSEPIRASRRPVASMIILWLVYGVIPFAIGVSLGKVVWLAVLLGAAWSAGRVSLSLLKDYKDAPGDARSSKKTFLLVYGGKRVARLSILLAAIGYVGCAMACFFHSPRIELLVVVAIAGWLLHERTNLLHHRQYGQLNDVFHKCLHYQLIFDGMVVVWFSI